MSHVVVYSFIISRHRLPEHGGNTHMFCNMWVPTYRPNGADYYMKFAAEQT